VLSLLEHWLSRSRQAAGLGRPRLRFVLPPNLPERLAVTITSKLQSTADAAGADIAWTEAPLDAEFTLIRQRVADSYDMVRVGLDESPLTATAVVAWSGDLPRRLQQVLFDTADAGFSPAYPSPVAA
jgi:hypothetical protein